MRPCHCSVTSSSITVEGADGAPPPLDGAVTSREDRPLPAPSMPAGSAAGVAAAGRGVGRLPRLGPVGANATAAAAAKSRGGSATGAATGGGEAAGDASSPEDCIEPHAPAAVDSTLRPSTTSRCSAVMEMTRRVWEGPAASSSDDDDDDMDVKSLADPLPPTPVIDGEEEGCRWEAYVETSRAVEVNRAGFSTYASDPVGALVVPTGSTASHSVCTSALMRCSSCRPAVGSTATVAAGPVAEDAMDAKA